MSAEWFLKREKGFCKKNIYIYSLCCIPNKVFIGENTQERKMSPPPQITEVL
jgi:hypothetical protein